MFLKDLRAAPILAVLSLLFLKLFWSSGFWDIYWDTYQLRRTNSMPRYFISELVEKFLYFQKITRIKLIC